MELKSLLKHRRYERIVSMVQPVYYAGLSNAIFLLSFNIIGFANWVIDELDRFIIQNPAASIGLYINSGSIYEGPGTHGATHLLERMAFKSTTNRSHLRIVREVEAIGGNINATASREQMGYTFDALKTHIPQMVELLIDSVRNPAFLDWEVNEEVLNLSVKVYSLVLKDFL